MLIRGDKLTAEQTKQVLNAFIYRWTTGNDRRESVYKNIQKPSIEPVSDEQWLKDQAFHFTKDGKRLMLNRSHAEPAFMASEE